MPAAISTVARRGWGLRGLGLALALSGSLVANAARAEDEQVAPTSRAAPAALLTRARLVELLRYAPDTRAGDASVAVSRSALAASGAAAENPLLSGLGGVRLNPDGGRPFAASATLSWPVELGGKRDARRGAAEAENREARASNDAVNRQLLLRALLEHAAALRDAAQLKIAEARLENSTRVLASAERRRAAGSVPPLDVALATLQRGRDAALAATAAGDREASLVRLQALLGLPASTPTEVGGPLVPELEPPPLPALLHRLDERVEVRAAGARVHAAKARAARERSLGSPTVSVLAQYERDDGSNVALVGLAVPIPVLSTNQLGKATSSAEVGAAQARLVAARATASGELRALYVRYEATLRARAALAPTAAAAKESMALATRAYELGEGDLASVLLVHREALEAERALLETEHAHAVARLELLVAVGSTPP